MAVFLRLLFLVPIGFALACFAAGAVIVFALIRNLAPIPWPGEIAGMVLVAGMAIGALAALPTLVAAILAEMFGWRSPFYWLAVGGLLAAIAVATPWLANQVQAVAAWILIAAWMPDVRIVENATPVSFATVALAAGFVGGFVYWLVVGRLAGYSDVASDAPRDLAGRGPLDRRSLEG
jgi:hypothetical protein